MDEGIAVDAVAGVDFLYLPVIVGNAVEAELGVADAVYICSIEGFGLGTVAEIDGEILVGSYGLDGTYKEYQQG